MDEWFHREEPSASRPYRPEGGRRWLWWWALASLAAALLGFYSRSLWDIDFFWHAATGRWIVETRGLPSVDPFGLYQGMGLASFVGLRYSWAAQVILYAALQCGGVEGVILLKASLLVLCAVVAYGRALRGGHAAALLLLVLIGMTLVHFTGARPQLFSFLMAGVVFALLDAARAGGRRLPLVLLPVATVVWANLHGGVALGGALLLAALGAVGGEWWLAPESRPAFPAALAASLAAAVAGTLVSPVGLALYRVVFQLEGSIVQQRSSEYLSPLELARSLGVYVPAFWLLILLVPIALWRFGRRRLLVEAVLVAVLAGLALRSFRYVPFFLLVAGPYLARGLLGWPFLAGRRLTVVVAALVGVAAPTALAVGTMRGQALQSGLAPGRFPVEAVELMKESGAEGLAFTHLNWGGFLTWHLYPRVRPFIDGRTIFFLPKADGTPSPDRHIFEKYTHVLWVTQEGKRFLREEGFDFVVVPERNPITGEVYPLNAYLMASAEWLPVFLKDGVHVYERLR